MSALLDAHEPIAQYLAAVEPPLIEHFELFARSSAGVRHLRELVLAFALEGRLLPQNPKDEPASLLLARIQDLKAACVVANKRRAVGAPGVESDQDAPYPAPQGWVWTTLAGIGVINPRIEADDKVMASFVQMSSIPIALSDAHVTEPRPWKDIKSGFTQFAEGDVGVAKITPCFENGKSTVFQHLDNGIGAGTTELHIVRPLCGIDPRYVLVFLKSPRFLLNGEAVMTGTAGQKRLPRSYFENCPFPLPPLAEQARIVARVDELMRLCDALEGKGRLEAEQHARLLSTLLGTLTDSTTPEELAANWQRVAAHFDLLLDRPEAVDALEKTMLQLAVRGKLVEQDSSDEDAEAMLRSLQVPSRRARQMQSIDTAAAPFELPVGWVWARFPELGEFGRGKSKHRPRNDPTLFNPPIYPLVQTGEVARANGTIREYHSKYSEVGLAQSHLWPAGTLCITIAANIADAAILGFDACFPDSVVGFVPAKELGSVEYFQAFMETARDHLIDFAPATAQKNINLEVLESLLIPVPPRREMHRIVTRVTELRRLCADLRERLAAQQAVQSQLADALVEQALA